MKWFLGLLEDKIAILHIQQCQAPFELLNDLVPAGVPRRYIIRPAAFVAIEELCVSLTGNSIDRTGHKLIEDFGLPIYPHIPHS